MHPRGDVARSRIARDDRAHQHPDQAAEYRGLRDGEGRVGEEVLVQRVPKGVVSRHEEREPEQDDEDEPRPGTPCLIRELEAEDPEQLHDAGAVSNCSRRRPMRPLMTLKYTSSRSGSEVSKPGSAVSL